MNSSYSSRLVMSSSKPSVNTCCWSASVFHFGYLPMIPVDPMGLADAATRKSWVDGKGMIVLAFFDPKLPIIRVDLMTDPVVPYHELEKSLVVKDLGGLPVRICSVDHLIQFKKEAGRPQDIDDIEVLERLKPSD